MDYISVVQFAEKYGISERTARNYCAEGKIEGAFLTGKTWNIPSEAPLPHKAKTKPSPLLFRLRAEKEAKLNGGIYHRTQIDLTYNSNHIEGSRLTKEQTRYIFETNTIGHNYREYFCRWHHRNSQSFSLYRLCHRPCNRANKRKTHKTAAFNPESKYFRQQQVLVCRWRLQAPSQRSRRRRNHQTKRSSQPHEKPDWQIQCNKNS